ncbi:MAG: CoA ester lyase [Pseudomonadota bacterium]
MRTVLFCPASKPRALAKLGQLRCDAVIIDLEDAVGRDQKTDARDKAKAFFAKDGAHQVRALRINGPGTPEFYADLELADTADVDAIVIPKVQRILDIEAVAGHVSKPLWIMIETAAGVLASAELAAHPWVKTLILGPNDLYVSLGASRDASRSALHTAMGHLILAGRAHACVVLDGVYNDFRDAEGLLAEAKAAKRLGFDGKTLIHPDQVPIVHQAFSPSEAELEDARALIDAYASGDGNAVEFRGRMVEELHVRAAKSLLQD